MLIDILTLFPNMFTNIINESIIKRAQESGRVKINIHNLRDWTHDRHRTVDDKPFGGGPGMVMKPEPIFDAVSSLRNSKRSTLSLRGTKRSTLSLRGTKRSTLSLRGAKRRSNLGCRIILLSPQGKRLNQRLAKKLSKYKHLILICGHYEGIDERVRRHLATDEISIGDYVLTCGELPAMVLIDSIVRLIPDVLGHRDSAKYESFESGLLEYPQYTRPADYKGMKVPKILLSGAHKKIEEWRRKESVKRTKQKRPDLIISSLRGPRAKRGGRSNLGSRIIDERIDS